jgi:hypothetical protein
MALHFYQAIFLACHAERQVAAEMVDAYRPIIVFGLLAVFVSPPPRGFREYRTVLCQPFLAATPGPV